MKKTFITVVACVVLIFSSTIQVIAGMFLLPDPFEIWSADGTTVFRWDPGPEENWHWHGMTQASVYRNGELLYTVENLPIRGQTEIGFFFSQDFQHLIHAPIGEVVALQFYSNGELIKTYYITDLVRDMRKVGYTSMSSAIWWDFIGDTRSPFEHIVERDILRVLTIDGILYEIDLTTGAIRNSIGGAGFWMRYGLLIAAGVFIVVILAIIRNKVAKGLGYSNNNHLPQASDIGGAQFSDIPIPDKQARRSTGRGGIHNG